MVEHNGIRVFVYGTLKQGNGLHQLLARGQSEYLGRSYIDSQFMLADMGAFPALVEDEYDPEARYRVFGEVYKVDHETLKALDFAEGHPNYYKRQRIETGDGEHKAWVYVLADTIGELAEDWIEDGVWCPSEGEKAYVSANQPR